ncbi:glutamyl-tRNA reductase [Alkalilimnicola sp. S0819]|uniref:glutamyl-tRNA reductase n=1 Tax=Alkalilimnicola sp. S0819 TaxID=2613922 RepID=UPI001262A77B|nr:glutamyl-tRNA reductase [Alkalilimnicola sp. S0819]KAB7623783.1 glutamyl-tRNA reductase [Alkalilimnicola sp. S0819]MPQ16656.1 glutamyl-tRNA reductase [Alkalilimnicola sp. S0819]
MSLLVLGLSHHSAPVEVRERVVFDAEQLQGALRELGTERGVAEAAIISTCNRTELYAVAEQAEVLRAWLHRHHRLAPDSLDGHLYQHEGEQAVHHLLRVASGLDSLVLGEPQILGQAKSAYGEALSAGTLGGVLDRLFQHSFAVAKQVRSDTAIGASPVSVAYAAVRLAHQIFGELGQQRALLIGAGEMMELTARHLRDHGLGGLTVANRSLEKAQQLAAQHQGRGIALPDIPAQLVETDIIIASTASRLPILGKGSVERALKARKHRPIFMVDMAVPRDIEPEVGELADVYLYTVDDLREVIQENLRSRREAARQAEAIIVEQSGRYLRWLRSQDAVALIREYRERARRSRDEVMARAQARLRRGEPAEQVLEYLAYTLTNKLTHAPTRGLREAAGEGEQATLAAYARLLDVARKPQ